MFDALPIFLFTASETKRDYYERVAERLKTLF